MRALSTLIGILAPVSAFAASGAGEESIGFMGWIFLGFFALIVVGQIMPAVMLMLGLVKGVAAKSEEVKSEGK